MQVFDQNSFQKHIRALIDQGELDLGCALRLKQASEQLAQRLYQGEQLRAQDMAFAHVDDLVGFGGIEADHRAFSDLQRSQRRPPPAPRWRQIWFADLGPQTMLRQRRLNSANEIAAIGHVVGMLELAAAAFREMTARRILVMRAGSERSIIEQGIARNAP
jgi:hypothetical protein